MFRTVILCLTLVFALGAQSQTIVEDFFTPDGGTSPITLNGGQKCAQRFTATLPFEGVLVNGPTWSVSGEKGMTIRLYKWNVNYDTTVAQTPIAVSVLVNLNDNDWFLCAAPAELPPGEYLWEASEPTNSNPNATDPFQIGCWRYDGSKYTGGEAYFNGVPYGEAAIEWERYYATDQTGTWTPYAFSNADNPTLAQSFLAPYEFQAVGLASPTWNGSGAGYRMLLYKWNTDYETTVAQTPIAEQTFTNLSDNARNELILKAPAASGRYLLVTDQPVRGTGNVGHWGWADSSWWDDENVAYADGEIVTTFPSYDFFLGTPSAEAVGKDFASRSVTGVATGIRAWELY
ncbi:MAG: hypothetical protein AB1656_10920 [Candidatus Omnitrophota bacterium]